MSESCEQFGKLPYSWITSGRWAKLTNSEKGVLGPLVGHVGGTDWTCWPSIETIATQAGVSVRTAQRTLKKLAEEEEPLVFIEKGGGRGRPNKYTLNPDVMHNKPCHIDDTLSSKKPRQTGAKTPSEKAANPVKSTPKPCHLDDTRTEGTERTEQQKVAAVSFRRKENNANAVRKLLEEHGITPTALVAQFPEMTANLVAEALKGCGPTAGPGAKVQIIKNQMPGLIQGETEAEAKREPLRQKLRLVLAKYEADYVAHFETIDTILESLRAEDVASLLPQITAALITRLGGSKAAKNVILEWYQAVGDPLRTRAGMSIAASIQESHERHRQASRTAIHTRRPKPEPTKADRKAQADKEGQQWFAELPDANVIGYFRRLMADEQTNKGFRERWVNADLDAQQIRANLNMRMGIIAMYGPGATAAEEAA